MRLMIVDDEILVRIGLKTMIPMSEERYEVVGEASNGQEALALLEQTPCDIVLTDIRMPEMDGLELLRHIHERWPLLKVLILSNHNDFEYVQTALRLGAAEYIMKLEMEPSELLDKLRLIREKLLAEQQKNVEVSQLEHKVNLYGREVKEKRLRELLQRHWTRIEMKELFREFPLVPLGRAYSVLAVQIEDFEALLEHNRFQSERLLTFTVGNVLTEICKKYGGGELAELEQGRFVIISPCLDASMPFEMRQAVHKFLMLSVSLGVSQRSDDPYAVHQAFSEATDALQYRFYLGRGQVVRNEELPAGMIDVMEPLDAEPWLRCIEENDEHGLQKLLSGWVCSSREYPVYTPKAVREQWVRLADVFARSLKTESSDINAITLHEGKYPHHIIRSAETQNEINEWFAGWIPVFLDYKKKHGKQKWRSEIQAVVRIITENLHLPMKVSELAEQVGFAENYLSILFKKETGETITDYTTRLRMKKARELLKDPELKIYFISEQVGYMDPNHFSRSFKQVEGMYPTEFRRLVLGKP
jgi:two-component system response regulator YesN